MSTWYYLECTSHSPYIRSSGEVEQHTHTDVLDAVRRAVRDRDQMPWVTNPAAADDYTYSVSDHMIAHARTLIDGDGTDYDFPRRCITNALWFNHEHPHCDVDLVTEYGDRETIIGWCRAIDDCPYRNFRHRIGTDCPLRQPQRKDPR